MNLGVTLRQNAVTGGTTQQRNQCRIDVTPPWPPPLDTDAIDNT